MAIYKRKDETVSATEFLEALVGDYETIELTGCIIEGDVRIDQAGLAKGDDGRWVVDKKVRCIGCTFKGVVDFTNSKIIRPLAFKENRFADRANFSSAIFAFSSTGPVSLPPLFSSTKKSISVDFSIAVEDHGEHHMSSWTKIFVPSQPIAGVSRFQTTNGHAFFSPDGNKLIIHDRCVIVLVDLIADEVMNYQPPKKWYLSNVGIEADSLRFELDMPGGQTKHEKTVTIEMANIESEFTPGLGSASDGRFPSAYP